MRASSPTRFLERNFHAIAAAIFLIAICLYLTPEAGVSVIRIGFFALPDILAMIAASLGMVFGLRVRRKGGQGGLSGALAGLLLAGLVGGASSISAARLESVLDLTTRNARQSLADIQAALRKDNLTEADREVLVRAERSERYLLNGRASTTKPVGTRDLRFQPSPIDVRRRVEIEILERQIRESRCKILAWAIVSVVALVVGFKAPLGQCDVTSEPSPNL